MKLYEIKHKISGAVLYSAESESFKETAELANKNHIALIYANLSDAALSGAHLRDANLIGANLRDADLRDADLSGANLRDTDLIGSNLRDTDLIGSNLRDANLRDADLRDANLSGADLSGANLSGADLSGAYLIGADLRDADLRDANLSGADLSGAYLRGSDLRGASLRGAYLSESQLRLFKHDLWGILLGFRNEIPGLVQSIKEGKIDGSAYSGKCACLMGTIANIRDCNIDELPKDPHSPAETWFSMIKPGDLPENNFAAKKALEWIEEFLSVTQVRSNSND